MVSLCPLSNIAIPILRRSTLTLRKVTLLKVRQSMQCPLATCLKDLLPVMLLPRSLLEHPILVKKLVASVLTRSRTRQLCLHRTLPRLLILLNKDLPHPTLSLSTLTLTPLS